MLLDEGIAPETVELDHSAYMRLRSRGDTRPASEPQIRQSVRPRPLGGARRCSTAARIASRSPRSCSGSRASTDIDALTRAQVQDVYDALEELIEQQPALAPAASA